MAKYDDQESLFASPQTGQVPLAQKMRPSTFDAIIGQTHFLNERFRKILETDRWTGFIFWGPPGTGKTTLANVIAQVTKRPFQMLSAVTSGVKDIREVLERSKQEWKSGRLAHVLFIDEFHRLNKAQQDVLLPYLEEGSIRLIGATTENPSFEINNAIASRCLIHHFEPLKQEELLQIIKRAAKDHPNIDEAVLERIANVSLGDARRALTLLDHCLISVSKDEKVTIEDFEKLTHAQSLYYDKKSEAHYDTISAFIKSVRGSDPDAAIYYLARMLEGGEDPVFIARRLMILASEDIGNASPMGLVLATSGLEAVHAIGMPEARIVLAQVTTYLACAEKSNRAYQAINEALDTVRETGNLEIPYAIRNAPTKMMKQWGYGKDYKYAHNFEQSWTEMQFLPEKIKTKRFYNPTQHGVEKQIFEFLKKRKGSESSALKENTDSGGTV